MFELVFDDASLQVSFPLAAEDNMSDDTIIGPSGETRAIPVDWPLVLPAESEEALLDIIGWCFERNGRK